MTMGQSNDATPVYRQLDDASAQTEEQQVAIIPRLFDVPIAWFTDRNDPKATQFLANSSATPIRETFERYWKIVLGRDLLPTDLRLFSALVTDKSLYNASGPILTAGEHGLVLAMQQIPANPTDLPILDNKSLIYLCLGKNNSALELDPALVVSADDLELFWSELGAVVQVLFDQALVQKAKSTSYVIGNVPLKLVRTYRLLEDAKTIMDAAIQAGKTSIPAAVAEVWQNNSPERLDSILGNYSSISQRRTLLNAQLVALSRQATAAGFYMPLKDETYTPPGGAAISLQAGNLYKVSTTVYRWTTYENRVRWEWAGDFGAALGIKRPRVETIAVEHSQQGSAYELVLPEADPWVSFVQQLPLTRPDLTKIHVFRKSNSTLISDTGDSINDVVDSCAIDEKLRRATIMLLPLSSFDAAGQEIIDAYQVIEGPLPQFTPLAPPRIFLQEIFSATTKWDGTQVGRLVSSINLGPGEDRTITLRTSAEFATTSTIVSSRSDDITDTSMVEFTSEAERFLERAFNQSSSSSTSFGISGLIKGVSFDLGVDGENSGSSSQLSRSISKIIDKAARTTTRKYSSSLTVTTTTSEKQSVETGIQYKVSNINQGRTLNLLLYQINNIYRSKILVSLSRIVLRSGQPYCAGCLLSSESRFRWSEMPELVFRATTMAEKIGIPDAREKICASLQNAIQSEFPVSSESGVTPDGWSVSSLNGVETLHLSRLGLTERAAKDASSNRLDFLALLMNARGENGEFDEAEVEEVVLKSTRHFVPSGAFFLDATVGFKPATEDYSNEMRLHEAAKAEALVRVEESKAAFGFAKAARLSHNIAPIVIKQAHRKPNSIEIVFDAALPIGLWIPSVFGWPQAAIAIAKPLREIDVVLEAGAIAELNRWAGMSDEQLLLAIRLREVNSGIVVVSSM